ncbi:MAG: substrate-binding domain-containing protein, partial [Oligoflexia bacterium]|nr:substrate-binding domain-containing protein [Oligoflexia bacterium]
FLLCEQMFQTYQNIRSVCKGIREVCKGPLRFATSDHITNDLLVNPILQFKKDYPLVTPSIYTGTPDEIVEHILKTECEFGLLFSRPLLPQIDYQVLREEQMLLVCQPDLWKKNKKASVNKTLKEVISNSGYISSLGALLQTRPSKVLKELFGEMPKISLETNNQEAQKRFCIEGGGVAYLSKFMVEEEVKSEKLFSIPMDDLHEFNLWIARRKGRHLSLSARTFLQFLRDNLDL